MLQQAVHFVICTHTYIYIYYICPILSTLMAGLTTIWKQDADFLLGGVRWNWPTFEEGWKKTVKKQQGLGRFCALGSISISVCFSCLI